MHDGNGLLHSCFNHCWIIRIDCGGIFLFAVHPSCLKLWILAPLLVVTLAIYYYYPLSSWITGRFFLFLGHLEGFGWSSMSAMQAPCSPLYATPRIIEFEEGQDAQGWCTCWLFGGDDTGLSMAGWEIEVGMIWVLWVLRVDSGGEEEDHGMGLGMPFGPHYQLVP